MNRSITFLGLLLLLVAIGCIASPFALTGVERFTLLVELGVFVLPAGLSVILWGAASPNPEMTTVGGLFGNPDENVLRRTLRPATPTWNARYIPGPRESANCRFCYTVIPWDLAQCPRCGRRRECRACGKPLFFLTGAVRCAPCLRDEVYCNCPKVRRTVSTVTGTRGRAR